MQHARTSAARRDDAEAWCWLIDALAAEIAAAPAAGAAEIVAALSAHAEAPADRLPQAVRERRAVLVARIAARLRAMPAERSDRAPWLAMMFGDLPPR